MHWQRCNVDEGRDTHTENEFPSDYNTDIEYSPSEAWGIFAKDPQMSFRENAILGLSPLVFYRPNKFAFDKGSSILLLQDWFDVVAVVDSSTHLGILTILKLVLLHHFGGAVR